MAVKAMSAALELKLGGHGIHNPAALKATLGRIGDCADGETLECWPGHDYLRGAAEVSKRTVIKHVQALVALRLIEIIGRGPHGVNRYRVLLHGPAKAPYFVPDWGSYALWLSENPDGAGGEEDSPHNEVNLTAERVRRERHTGEGSEAPEVKESPVEPRKASPKALGTGTTEPDQQLQNRDRHPRAGAREGQSALNTDNGSGTVNSNNLTTAQLLADQRARQLCVGCRAEPVTPASHRWRLGAACWATHPARQAGVTTAGVG